MRDQDLTLAEAREGLNALQAEIGSKCQIFASIDLNRRYGSFSGNVLSAQIYPRDMLGRVTLSAAGDTWTELLADCRRAWAAHTDTHAESTIRDIALAIIRITADLGQCTDAALRAEFEAEDVARYSERACQRANEMAGNGPFSIVTLSGANDAEAA